MKNRLFLFLWVGSFGQSVPNTNTFSLQDVVTVTGGSSLPAAFTNSVDAYFDATYKGSKDRLSNFRNYTIPETEVTVSGITQTNASFSFVIRSAHGVITADGMAISTSTNPVVADALSVFSSESCGCEYVSVGIYRGGLSANTTYYYRVAYSTSTGTYYGPQGSFTTLP